MPDPVDVFTTTTRLAWLYGLGIVLAIAITMAFLWMTWYVLRTTHERELSLSNIINGTLRLQQDQFLQHDQRMSDAMRALTEANQYQRQEHKELIELVREIRLIGGVR